jgi:hypothetical protein
MMYKEKYKTRCVILNIMCILHEGCMTMTSSWTVNWTNCCVILCRGLRAKAQAVAFEVKHFSITGNVLL